MRPEIKKYLLITLSIVLLLSVAFFMQKVEKSKKESIAKAKKVEKVQPLAYEGSMVVKKAQTIEEINAMMNAAPSAGGGTFDMTAMAGSITAELEKAFGTGKEFALPLIAQWNAGTPDYGDGLDPMYMIDKLQQGEHILVSWKLNPYYDVNLEDSYYEESIKKAAELHLPLVFLLPSPESALYQDNFYFSLSKKENPNLVTNENEVLAKLSPFGPDDVWSKVGKDWGSMDILAKIQEWYPNPPFVLFVSEDEANKLNWSEVNESSRNTLDDNDENFVRSYVNAQWIEKYRQLHEGFKAAFTAESWKKNAKFIAYNRLSQDMGKSAAWKKSATYTNSYINVWPLTADGLTVDFDLLGDADQRSFNAPHITANNLPFMLAEAKTQNSGFLDQLNLNADGKIDNPAEYRGFTQFALWFLRPAIVRQKTVATTKEDINATFNEVVDSVELIHYNDELASFWRDGRLLKSGESDLNVDVPAMYANDPRWFLLENDVNPKRPWDDLSEISVWSFALVKGEAPNREWLLYAQAPDGNMKDVTVTIPEYKDVMVDATQMGSFYVLKEGEDSEKELMVDNLNFIYPPDSKLVKIATVNFNYPDYLVPYTDPVFHTKVIRITDPQVFGYENPRHDYSRVQAWNADSTYLRIRDQLLDGSTYKIIKKIPWLSGMKWSHSEPNIIYGFSRGKFIKQDVLTEKQELLGSFLGYDKISIGEGEGSLSLDDKNVVFTAKKGEDLIIIVFNIIEKKIISQVTYSKMWENLKWVSISPSGKYVVFSWIAQDTVDGVNDVFDLQQTFIHRLDGTSAHSDLCIDQYGNEVLVKFQFGDKELSDARGIWSYRLDDNSKKVQLLPSKYNGGHISCQNYKRPGWAYISTKQEGYREVFALKLDGTTNGTVEQFAQHHSSSITYKAEPQASPNPDGTKVIFASDWEGTQDSTSFVVESSQ